MRKSIKINKKHKFPLKKHGKTLKIDGNPQESTRIQNIQKIHKKSMTAQKSTKKTQ